jgi:lipopolysaccharide transport system permease protein
MQFPSANRFFLARRVQGRVKGQRSAADSTSPLAPHFVHEPSRGWVSLGLKSLWEYRELFYFLAWRDVKVRYKQTAIGVVWAVLQPVITMFVFSLFFGYLGRLSSDGLPYPVFAYAALLPWQLFVHSLSASANSLVLNQALITKVYFPRLVVPLSTVVVGLIDFACSFLVFLGLLIYYGFLPTLAMLTLPAFVLLAVLTALAAGLWLSALNVQYRDVQHTIPFLTQCWLFASPVVYSSSLIPPSWRLWYGLNPLVGVIEGFRWALLGQARPLEYSLLLSIVVAGAFFVGGLTYFRRMERTFADVV